MSKRTSRTSTSRSSRTLETDSRRASVRNSTPTRAPLKKNLNLNLSGGPNNTDYNKEPNIRYRLSNILNSTGNTKSNTNKFNLKSFSQDSLGSIGDSDLESSSEDLNDTKRASVNRQKSSRRDSRSVKSKPGSKNSQTSTSRLSTNATPSNLFDNHNRLNTMFKTSHLTKLNSFYPQVSGKFRYIIGFLLSSTIFIYTGLVTNSWYQVEYLKDDRIVNVNNSFFDYSSESDELGNTVQSSMLQFESRGDPYRFDDPYKSSSTNRASGGGGGPGNRGGGQGGGGGGYRGGGGGGNTYRGSDQSRKAGAASSSGTNTKSRTNDYNSYRGSGSASVSGNFKPMPSKSTSTVSTGSALFYFTMFVICFIISIIGLLIGCSCIVLSKTEIPKINRILDAGLGNVIAQPFGYLVFGIFLIGSMYFLAYGIQSVLPEKNYGTSLTPNVIRPHSYNDYHDNRSSFASSSSERLRPSGSTSKSNNYQFLSSDKSASPGPSSTWSTSGPSTIKGNNLNFPWTQFLFVLARFLAFVILGALGICFLVGVPLSGLVNDEKSTHIESLNQFRNMGRTIGYDKISGIGNRGTIAEWFFFIFMIIGIVLLVVAFGFLAWTVIGIDQLQYRQARG